MSSKRSGDPGMAGGNGAPFVLDGEMLRLVNEEQGYRYRQQQRYLQEDDRVEIIRRIDAGERQSELAREFRVTRAAICNTYKNREEILARSRHVYDAQCAAILEVKDRDRSKTHSGGVVGSGQVAEVVNKKRRRTQVHATEAMKRSESEEGISASGGTQSAVRFSNVADFTRLQPPPVVPERRIKREPAPTPQVTVTTGAPRIQQLLSAPVVRLLYKLRDKKTPVAGFRENAGQLIRLLIEKSLVLATVSTTTSTRPSSSVVAVGVGAGGYPFLRNYQEMYPDKTIGILRFQQTQSPTQLLDASLPSGICSAASVMLMTSECATGLLLCRAIQELVSLGVPETAIVLVVAFASKQGLVRVEREYPAIRGLVAAIDEHVDALGGIQPGCGGFIDRYYDVDLLEDKSYANV